MAYFKYAENFNITDDINLNYDDTITRASCIISPKNNEHN